MRRLALGKVGYVGDPSNRFDIGGSATAIGLIVPVGDAPPAAALPCSAPEANVPPPAGMPNMPTPAPVVAPPTGRRPRGTNDNAPLPKLGPLISSLLKPLTPKSRATSGGGNACARPARRGIQQPPNAAQMVPNADPVPPPPPAGIAGAPTSLVDFVTGPNSPNKTLERFGISGTDLGIPWDNGDPGNRQVLMAFGDTFGYCSVHGQQWRYNTLFRSQDRDLSHGIHVADGVPNNPYSGSPVWAPGLSKQVVNSIHKAGHETGIIPTAAISLGRTQYMNFMSIKNWGRDGDWSTNYSGIARSLDNGQIVGDLPRQHPPGRGGHRARRTVLSGQPELPDGSLHAGQGRLPLLVRNPVRPRRSGVSVPSSSERFAGSHQVSILEW